MHWLPGCQSSHLSATHCPEYKEYTVLCLEYEQNIEHNIQNTVHRKQYAIVQDSRIYGVQQCSGELEEQFECSSMLLPYKILLSRSNSYYTYRGNPQKHSPFQLFLLEIILYFISCASVHKGHVISLKVRRAFIIANISCSTIEFGPRFVNSRLS